MATVPIVDATDSRSTEQDGATRQFQRLQRVRARQRSRRRRRLIFVAPLLVGLAGAGVVIFAAILGTSLERLLDARAPSSGDTTPRPAFSTIVTDPGPTVAPAAALAAPLPAGTRAVSVARLAPARPVPRAALPHAGVADRPGPAPLEERQDDEVVAPVRDEPRNAEVADPASVIDWLLNRSRTNGR